MKLTFFQKIHTLWWSIYNPKRNRLYHYNINLGFDLKSSYQSAKNLSSDAVNFIIK